jgi:hypothetical protein
MKLKIRNMEKSLISNFVIKQNTKRRSTIKPALRLKPLNQRSDLNLSSPLKKKPPITFLQWRFLIYFGFGLSYHYCIH